MTANVSETLSSQYQEEGSCLGNILPTEMSNFEAKQA